MQETRKPRGGMRRLWCIDHTLGARRHSVLSIGARSARRSRSCGAKPTRGAAYKLRTPHIINYKYILLSSTDRHILKDAALRRTLCVLPREEA